MKFGRHRVRFFGIDAPEREGNLATAGHWYPGPLATKALVTFIADRPVSCHQVAAGLLADDTHKTRIPGYNAQNVH